MVVPPKHSKMIIFSRKTHGCWKPTILGNPHIYPIYTLNTRELFTAENPQIQLWSLSSMFWAAAGGIVIGEKRYADSLNLHGRLAVFFADLGILGGLLAINEGQGNHEVYEITASVFVFIGILTSWCFCSYYFFLYMGSSSPLYNYYELNTQGYTGHCSGLSKSRCH